MKITVEGYFSNLRELLEKIQATDKQGQELVFARAVDSLAEDIFGLKGGRVFAVGNGASAAIASHFVTDLMRSAGVPALAFNDAAGLTCFANDYGYPNVFVRPIELIAGPGDILFAISSSGRSENILNAVAKARDKGARVVTLSGFKTDNPLRSKGDLNFYVSKEAYGLVELVHHSICHCVTDLVAGRKNG